MVSPGCLPPTGPEESEEDGWVGKEQGRQSSHSGVGPPTFLRSTRIMADAPMSLSEGPQGNGAGWIQCLREDLDPPLPEGSKRPVGGNSAPKLAGSFRK